MPKPKIHVAFVAMFRYDHCTCKSIALVPIYFRRGGTKLATWSEACEG
jgi:hypothetical protein